MDDSHNQPTERVKKQEEAEDPSTHDDNAERIVESLNRLVSEVSSDRPTGAPRIDRFELREILGDHGVASVYLAYDPELDRKVVVKVFPSSLSKMVADRVLKEGRALCKIDNPHVAKCFDVGEDDGQLYLVLEFVPGTNLGQSIIERRFDTMACLEIVDQIAEGLASVHESGLLHGDVKPTNVILTPSGHAKLIDFGLAESYGADEVFSRSGTPAYMAPERANGQEDQIDHRSDLFGVGGILYHMLTFRAPFEAADKQSCLQLAQKGQVQSAMSIRKEIPGRVNQLCMQALSFQPDDRYQSMDEFRRAIRSAKRHWFRGRAFAAVATLVAVGFVGLAFAFPWGRPSDRGHTLDPDLTTVSKNDFDVKLTSKNLNEFVAVAFNEIHINGTPESFQRDFDIELGIVEVDSQEWVTTEDPNSDVVELLVDKDYQIRIVSSRDCYVAVYGFNGEATDDIELFEIISPLNKEQFFVKKDEPYDVPLGLAETAKGKLDRFYLVASDRFWPPDEVQCIGNHVRAMEKSEDAERRWGIERGGKNEKVTAQMRSPQVISERMVQYRVIRQGGEPETDALRQTRKRMLKALELGRFQLALEMATELDSLVKKDLANHPAHPWHRTISVELESLKKIIQLKDSEKQQLKRAFEFSVEAEQLHFANKFLKASQMFAKSARTFDSVLGKGSLFSIRNGARVAWAAEQKVEDWHVRLLHNVLDQHVKLLGENHVETLEVKRRLCLFMGNRRLALKRLLEICDYYEKHDFEVHHVSHTWATYNASLVYGQINDFPNCSLMMKAAKDVSEKCGEDSVMVAIVLKELGRIEHTNRNYQLAEKYFSRAIEIGTKTNLARTHSEDKHADTTLLSLLEFQSRGLQQQVIYLDLSDEEKKERLAKSLTYAESAAELAKDIYGDQSWIYGNVLSNLGEANYRNDQIETALEIFKESLRIYNEVESNQGPKLPMYQFDVAKCYSKLKRYVECDVWLQKVIASKKHLSKDRNANNWEAISLWRAHRTRGINFQLMGNKEKAFSEFVASIDASLDAYSDSYFRMSDDQLRSFSENLRITANLLAASTDPDNRDVVRESFRKILQSKGLISGQLVRRNRVFGIPGKHDSEKVTQSKRALMESQLLVSKLGMRRWVTNDTPAGNEALIDARDKSQTQEQRLLRSAANDSTFDDGSIVDQFSFLEQKLPKEVAFIEFLRADHFKNDEERKDKESVDDEMVSRYVAYVVNNSDDGLQVQLVQFENAEMIDLAIQAWNESVLERPIPHPTETRGGKAKARKRKFPKSLGKPERYLRQNVWSKLEPYLGRMDQLVFCPDSYLANLPWCYLPIEQDGKLLIEDYEISYASSMHMVLESLNREIVEGRKCLAIGDIDYGEFVPFDDKTAAIDDLERGKRVISNFEPLNTRVDLKVAEKYFADPDQLTLVTGKEATEKRLLTEMPKYHYLIIGTHGFALPESTELLGASGIALSDANQFILNAQKSVEQETVFDSFITGTEIGCVNLENTNLVVLSACECGRGRILDGEAVFGIQSAYLTSGARSTISSLYRVSDDAAPRILDEFLSQHLEQSASKSTSMRRAQLKLKNAGVPAKYWVYWTLNGDWR